MHDSLKLTGAGTQKNVAIVLLRTTAPQKLYPGWGVWVAQSVKRLPSAQVMIPGSWDQAQRRLPAQQESASPSPSAPPSACALSFSNK